MPIRSDRATSGFVALGLALAVAVALRAGRGSGWRTPADRPPAGASARLPVHGAAADFTLTERSGRLVSRADLAGKVWIADFVFTRCAGPCPALTSRMARLQRDLPPRDDLRLVTFTVDPDYDTPAVLAEYARRYGAEPERWLFLTGPKEAIRHLSVEGFKMGLVEAPPELGGITHDTHFALVDRAGRIRGYYGGEDDAAVAKLKRSVAVLLDESPNSKLLTPNAGR